MTGIWTSIRITANVRSITARSAASPESTSTIVWPSGSRTETIERRLPALSSTTRIAAAGSGVVARRVTSARPGSAGAAGNHWLRAASSSAVSTGLGM